MTYCTGQWHHRHDHRRASLHGKCQYHQNCTRKYHQYYHCIRSQRNSPGRHNSSNNQSRWSLFQVWTKQTRQEVIRELSKKSHSLTINQQMYMLWNDLKPGPTLKPSYGFEAVQTALKPPRPFWNPKANAGSFKAAQGNPCSLLDCFKAVCSDGTNPLKTSIHPLKLDCF